MFLGDVATLGPSNSCFTPWCSARSCETRGLNLTKPLSCRWPWIPAFARFRGNDEEIPRLLTLLR